MKKSMTVNEMRNYISKRYNTMKWKTKVAQMPTHQVIAIYKSFKDREYKRPAVEEDPHYHQIDMFEYMYSINKGKETHTEVNV